MASLFGNNHTNTGIDLSHAKIGTNATVIVQQFVFNVSPATEQKAKEESLYPVIVSQAQQIHGLQEEIKQTRKQLAHTSQSSKSEQEALRARITELEEQLRQMPTPEDVLNKAIEIRDNLEVFIAYPEAQEAKAALEAGDLVQADALLTQLIEFGAIEKERQKHAEVFYTRGSARELGLNLSAALQDYKEAVHLQPTNATYLSGLGFVLFKLSEYPEAEDYLNKALEIYKQQLDADDLNIGISYDRLASLYYAQSRYSEVANYYQKALKIYEQKLGFEHPSTATCYHNLAELYKTQGQYPEAEDYFKKALKIYEQKLGFDHPSTATCYNRLAGFYKAQSQYFEAERYYKKALKIYEQKLGLNHPDTGTSYNNLAGLYQICGKYTEAEDYFKKALKIYEQQLGFEHPSTATCYHNLASLYQDIGQYPKAEAGYNQAMAIREKRLGLKHSDTASSYDKLAGLYLAQGNSPKAILYFEAAFWILCVHLKGQHQHASQALQSLFIAYQMTGWAETEISARIKQLLALPEPPPLPHAL